MQFTQYQNIYFGRNKERKEIKKLPGLLGNCFYYVNFKAIYCELSWRFSSEPISFYTKNRTQFLYALFIQNDFDKKSMIVLSLYLMICQWVNESTDSVSL